MAVDLLREFAPWGVEAVVGIAMLRGEKDKVRSEIKDTLTRYYDRNIKPSVSPTPQQQQQQQASAPIKYPLSPFDVDVDYEAFLTGVRKGKAKK